MLVTLRGQMVKFYCREVLSLFDLFLQDAHEFLCQVFDQLKDDVSKSNSPSSKDTSSGSNPKVRIFMENLLLALMIFV